MANNFSYAWEKFNLAVSTLATSPDTIKERVADVFIYHLGYFTDRITELPPVVRDDFEELASRVTGQGGYKVALSQVSEEEASLMARKIVDLYGEIDRATR